jgi:hypothetical protein
VPEVTTTTSSSSLAFVHGGVAHAPEVVKERPLRGADDVALPQPVDQSLLPLLGTDEEADFRRRAFREDFAELAKLEDTHWWIRREVLLSLRS